MLAVWPVHGKFVHLSVSLKLKALAHDIAKSEKVPVSRTFVHETVLTRYFHSKIKPFGGHWESYEPAPGSEKLLPRCPLFMPSLLRPPRPPAHAISLMPSPCCHPPLSLSPLVCPCPRALSGARPVARALALTPVSNHLNGHDGCTSMVIDEPASRAY